MKILAVTHETSLSGANKSLVSIAETLGDKVQFDFVLNSADGELVDALKGLNVNLIYENYGWWFAQTRSNKLKKLYRKVNDGIKYYLHRYPSEQLIERLRAEKYDIVYTNTGTVDYGAIIAEKIGVPHIWHVREFGKEDFGFQNLCSQKYYRKIYGSAALIIAISNAIKQKYSSYADESNIRVIYNGFDVQSLYAPFRRHELSKKVSILMCGQVCAAKGQDQAIAACKKLIGKGYPIELNLAGNIDRDYLKSTAPGYENYKWLILHGQVKNMYELRNSMDLELVCSRSEAFGRVTIEAMLHGVPVIGANTGGTVEMIENGETGLLYELGNTDKLAEAIESLITDGEKYNYIANKAQDYAKGFTIEKTAESVYDAFCEFSAKNDERGN